jgi:hypothetical protein
MKNSSVSLQSPRSISPKGKGDRGGAKTPLPEPSPDVPFGDRGRPGQTGGLVQERDEVAERDAIQNEARYATRQSIPQELMVKGLIASYSGRSPVLGATADMYRQLNQSTAL